MIDKLEMLAAGYLLYGMGAMGFCYVNAPWEQRRNVTPIWIVTAIVCYPLVVMSKLVLLVLDPNHDRPLKP